MRRRGRVVQDRRSEMEYWEHGSGKRMENRERRRKEGKRRIEAVFTRLLEISVDEEVYLVTIDGHLPKEGFFA